MQPRYSIGEIILEGLGDHDSDLIGPMVVRYLSQLTETQPFTLSKDGLDLGNLHVSVNRDDSPTAIAKTIAVAIHNNSKDQH